MSCGSEPLTEDLKTKTFPIQYISSGRNDVFFVIEIDSCEYVVYDGNNSGAMVHKANCKNHK